MTLYFRHDGADGSYLSDLSLVGPTFLWSNPLLSHGLLCWSWLKLHYKRSAHGAGWLCVQNIGIYLTLSVQLCISLSSIWNLGEFPFREVHERIDLITQRWAPHRRNKIFAAISTGSFFFQNRKSYQGHFCAAAFLLKKHGRGNGFLQH